MLASLDIHDPGLPRRAKGAPRNDGIWLKLLRRLPVAKSKLFGRLKQHKS
jgi:hypothetical protein